MPFLGALITGAAAMALMLALRPTPVGRAPHPGLARSSTMDRQRHSPRGALALAALHRVGGRLRGAERWVRRADLVEAGIDPAVVSPAEVFALKVLSGAALLATAVVLSAALPPMLVFAPALAWLGFTAPSLWISRRRARRRAAILTELPDLVGLLRAFVNAQVPLEQALDLISRQLAGADPDNILAAELRLALSDYGLGLTIGDSLVRMADRVGVEELKTVVGAIAQGKRLGSGMEMILRDQEILARMAQRNRATASASQVSTRLMGVLVGVYLPEFVLLVMLPLFWGVILRAFG